MKTFTDTEFLSAKDKALIDKQWRTFCKWLSSPNWLKQLENNGGSDYGLEAPRIFTDRIYTHLHLHCGYIAHYNIHGFFSEYFNGKQESLLSFLRQFNSWGEYTDISDAMMQTWQEYEKAIMQNAMAQDNGKFSALQQVVKEAENDPELKRTLVAKLL